MVFKTHIVAHKEIAKGTHEVTLERPKGFEFQSGQYTQIEVPNLIKSDPKGRSRQFSIASSPEDQTHVRVVFRSTGSGFKETLTSSPVGYSVMLEQASGSFILPQRITRPHVFIAGGVGITPFMSYLLQRVQDTWDYPITLFYGNQSPESAAYLSELKVMAKEQKHFTVHGIYKRPTSDLFAKFTQKYPNAVWWVVGPPAMVSVTTHGLKAGGVPTQNILTESFEGY